MHHSLGFCKFKHILGQEEKRKKERLKSILQRSACSYQADNATEAFVRNATDQQDHGNQLPFLPYAVCDAHKHTTTDAQNSPSDAKARWKSSKCAKNHRKPMSAVKSMTALCTATSCLPEQRKDEQGGVEFQEFCFRITPAQTCCVITTSDCAIYLFSDILPIFLFYFRKKFQVCERNMNVEEECSEQYF